MKKQIFFIALFLLMLLTVFSKAQYTFDVPEAINYQAILRNSMGNVMPNQNVSVKLSIIDSLGGFFYSEKFDTTTNQFGLINLEIGRGTVLSGGTFSEINWYWEHKFLKVEIDTSGSGSYITMGTSQLISVPYAECAKYAGPWMFYEMPHTPFYPPSVIWFTGNSYTSVGVGTSTPNPEAILVLSSSNQGLLVPRLTTVQRLNINVTLGSSGLLVYDINFEQFFYFIAQSSTWVPIVSGNASSLNYWTQSGSDLYYNSGNVGIGTATPQTPLHVATGDVYIENIGSGVIMKSPNGNCWRMTVDNSGNPVFTQITCP